MAWVKLNESDLDYDFASYGSLPVSQNPSGDVVISSASGDESNIVWNIDTNGDGIRFKVDFTLVGGSSTHPFSVPTFMKIGSGHNTAISTYVWEAGAESFSVEFTAYYHNETPGELGWYFDASGDFSGLSGTFEIFVWVEDEEPPGPDACFWTDLVNAEQVCDSAPPTGGGGFDIPAYSTMRATKGALENFTYGGYYIVGGYPVHADSIDDATAIAMVGYFGNETGIHGEDGFWDGATPQPLTKDSEPYQPTHDDLTLLAEPISLVLTYNAGWGADVWELGSSSDGEAWYNQQGVFLVSKPGGAEYHVGYTQDYGVG